MGLEIGDVAPDFELPSTGGGTVSLATLRGQPFVLYFYPKDFTSVCTKQACAFRDGFAGLRDLEVAVYGVSRDDLDTHKQFKAEHRLPFELLSDLDRAVSRAYKARVPLIGVSKRITYLIGGDGRVKAAHDEMLGHGSHVAAIREALEVEQA